MRLMTKVSHLPPRIAAGAFILNSGVGKWAADEETAAQLHGFAVGTYPFLAKLKPRDFARLLAASEIALGAALLVPVIPSALVGAGLTAFSGGLLGLYARTPGMRKDGTPFPTQQGIAIAKDVWMLGIGLGLVIDDLTDLFGTGPGTCRSLCPQRPGRRAAHIRLAQNRGGGEPFGRQTS
jgi:hypothetical protein